MYPALRLPPTGKLTQRTSAAAHVCTTTTCRLFMTDRLTRRQFLIDTGSDLCVYPPSSSRDVWNYSNTICVQLRALPSTPTDGCLSASIWDSAAIISVDFLSHFGLLADCRNNRLLDGVTSLSAQAASSRVPSVKTIVGGTTVDSLLAEIGRCLT
jgi:hypothetical protein